MTANYASLCGIRYRSIVRLKRVAARNSVAVIVVASDIPPRGLLMPSLGYIDRSYKCRKSHLFATLHSYVSPCSSLAVYSSFSSSNRPPNFVDPFIPFPFPSFCLANHFNYFLRNGFWTTCTPFTGSSIQCSTSTLDRASECGEARGRPVSLL